MEKVDTIKDNITWRCRMYTSELLIRLYKVVSVDHHKEVAVWSKVKVSVESTTDGTNEAVCIQATNSVERS